jgi:hypothetical protein
MTLESFSITKSPLASFYAICALVIVGSFAFLRGSPALTPEALCTKQGGEWLNGSAEPTCVMKSGEFLVFDEGSGDFIDPAAGEVLAVQDEQPRERTMEPAENQACAGEFTDYPIEGVMADRGVVIDFSSWPDAAKYRSAINRDYARGANFADHYVVANWGCPDFAGCEGHAVIDTSTGKILSYGETSLGTDFTKDSRLLIVNFEDEEDRYILEPTSGELKRCE